jgi:TolB protein
LRWLFAHFTKVRLETQRFLVRGLEFVPASFGDTLLYDYCELPITKYQLQTTNLKPSMRLLLCLLPICGLAQQPVVSQLETFDITTNKRTVILRDTGRFEAPNWSKDNKYLVINQGGGLYRVALPGGQRTRINTGVANANNNDHGISPDGNFLIISNYTDGTGKDYRTSQVCVVPIGGGEARQVTQTGPSFWHGITPDGKTLAYVGERTQPDGSQDFDIYTIPTAGGTEKRLTTTKGLDDGPEYSPDGTYLYMNSMRGGKMDIWRVKATNGSDPKQLTNDAYSNWFPHPSPDGRWLLFISYLEDQGSRHPADKAVMLRLLDLQTGKLRELCRFRGGQGSINVPNWAPDSHRFAFVTYPEK